MAKIYWIFVVYFLILNGYLINTEWTSCSKTREPLTDRNPRPVVGETFFASERLLNSQNTNLDYFKSVFTLPDKYKEIKGEDGLKNISASNLIVNIDDNVYFMEPSADIEADELWLRSIGFGPDEPYIHNVKRFHYRPRVPLFSSLPTLGRSVYNVLRNCNTSLLTVFDVSIVRGSATTLKEILSTVTDAKLEVLRISGYTGDLSGDIENLTKQFTSTSIATQTIKYLSLTNFINGCYFSGGFSDLFPCLQVLDLSNTYSRSYLLEILSFHPTLEIFIAEYQEESRLNQGLPVKQTLPKSESTNRVKRDAITDDYAICFGGKYKRGYSMPDYDIECDNTSGITWNKTFQISALKSTLELQNLPEVEGLYFEPDPSCRGGMRVPIAPKLQELYIQRDGLARVLLWILDNTWWLRTVDTEPLRNVCLKKNNITSFHISISGFMHSLLSDELFNVSSFTGLEQLNELSLNHMQFNYIPEALLQHKDFPHLTTLNLNNNNISFGEWFRMCKKLKRLAKFSISSNDLTFLPHSVLRDCVDLVTLDLSFNSLQTLPNSLLSGTTNLVRIDISFNLLRSLPHKLFTGCNKLQFVDLSHNLLHSIPEQIRIELETYHVTIDLSNNLLSCSCHPDAIGTLLHLHNNKHRYHNYNTYHCTGFERVQLMLDVDVEKYTSSCVKWLPHEVAILTAGCCAIFVVFWISIWLLIKCRYRVVTCMYRVRTCLQCGKRPRYENGPVVFAFDLYLVYCNEDREWVHYSLIDVLETKHGFNCCVHYRDFPCTGDIDEVITKYMRHSRDIVVILSRHSINKQWPSFEIKNAQQLERRHGKRIFYIKLGCLGDNIPERVKRVLESRIYLEWPEQENDKNVAHFYDKLVATIQGKAMCGSCCSCFRSKQIVTPYDNLSTPGPSIPLRAMHRN